jgi:predicted nucleic acid-binding protein
MPPSLRRQGGSMIAIDTNVVVRYLTGDHPEQSPRSRALVDGQSVFVAVTVMLETEWVLRSAYGYGVSEVVRALRAFGGLPSVAVEDAADVAAALDRTERGMDFADALHLGRSEHCEAFASFDRKLIKSAQAAGIQKAVEP